MIKMRELGKALRKSALLLAGVLFTTAVQPAMWANAAQAVEDCVLFACGDGDSIYVDAGHINMNGDIVTNGKFTTTLETLKKTTQTRLLLRLCTKAEQNSSSLAAVQ